MLAQRKAVGHSGDEIRDPARACRPHRPRRARRAHSSGMSFGCTKKRANKRAHHLLGVGHHGDHARMAVHVGPEERLDGAIGRGHHGREADHRRAGRAHLVGRGRRRGAEPPHALGHHVLDQSADQAAHQLVRRAAPDRCPGYWSRDLAQQAADHRHLREVGEREQIGAQAVVEVVRIVGDVVGDRRDLRLRARHGSRARDRALRCNRR